MEGNFSNKLTDAQYERLVILAEECNEVIQIIGKILGHGYESYHPSADRSSNNRVLLQKEIGDFQCILQMMINANDVNEYAINIHKKSKSDKIKQDLHHQ